MCIQMFVHMYLLSQLNITWNPLIFLSSCILSLCFFELYPFKLFVSFSYFQIYFLINPELEVLKRQLQFHRAVMTSCKDCTNEFPQRWSSLLSSCIPINSVKGVLPFSRVDKFYTSAESWTCLIAVISRIVITRCSLSGVIIVSLQDTRSLLPLWYLQDRSGLPSDPIWNCPNKKGGWFSATLWSAYFIRRIHSGHLGRMGEESLFH